MTQLESLKRSLLEINLNQAIQTEKSLRKMCKNMHNVIVFIEQSEFTFHVNQKIANLFLNRFTIEEEAAFEALGVYYLGKLPKVFNLRSEEFKGQRQAKAKE